jgi:T-complex protein 1 subunit epsilon
MRAFGDALESIPLALAENSGFSPVSTLAEVKKQQIAQKNPFIGVDCLQKGTMDMKEQKVFRFIF